MLLEGFGHNLEDCESATHDQLSYLEHPKTGEESLEQCDDCSVTYEDQKSMIFLVKECEEVESRPILRAKTLLGNQLQHDQSYKINLAASHKIGNRMPSSLGESTEENHDGLQTPTRVMDVTPSTGLKCPPAPKKPKATPLWKRKRECRNLQVEFVDEVELVLRLLSSEVDTKLKRARPVAAAEANGSSLGA